MAGAKPKLKIVKRRHPIQRRLSEMGKTQKWLAHELGVSEKTVGNWVSGRVMLFSSNIDCIRLRKILGINKNYLHR